MNKLHERNYFEVLDLLKEKIRHSRYRAVLSINYELLTTYWEIGKTILEQQKKAGWGAKIIDRLAVDLKMEFPDFKGLSVRNLKYMRAFAETYPEFSKPALPSDAQTQNTAKTAIVQQPAAQIGNGTNDAIVQQLAAQLPWGHHQVLLDKVKTREQRLFYMQQCVENGWSRSILVMQIENGLYERQGKAISNFGQTLPQLQSDLVQQSLKNPYIFDFINFGEEIKERELEKALIQHLKKFMLELGKGFAYVGNQFDLTVENDEYFLDLLFYNYRLHRFVIFELKIGDFKPEYAGKLNFYINTVDAQIKSDKDDATIGILLCKTPNELVIRYSLQGIKTPIGVSEYLLKKGIPKVLKTDLPSIEELEANIEDAYAVMREGEEAPVPAGSQSKEVELDV